MAVNDTDELVATIRLRGGIPTNAGSWTTAAILLEAWRQLLTNHAPMLIAARGEYYVQRTNQILTVGADSYRMPTRAAAIRHLSIVGTDSIIRPIVELGPEEQAQVRAQSGRIGRPLFYEFTGQQLVLWPVPQLAETLRIAWHIRAGRLVANSTDGLPITAVALSTPSAGSTRLTFSANPPGSATVWSEGTKNDAGTKTYDICKRNSPFEVVASDVVPTASTATTMTFTSTDVPSSVGVGDVVTPAAFAVFPQVPVELHLPLALRTAAAIIGPKNDDLQTKLLDEAGGLEKQLLIGILAPRSKGNSKRLANFRVW